MGTTRQGKFLLPYMYRREVGKPSRVGERSGLSKMVYSALTAVNTWDPASTVDNTHHGSVFNLGYSTDGAMLVAACERRSILLFDPHNGRLLAHNSKAHKNCVNCIKFLDTRTFVTCSDDMTVALWDCRNLSSRVRSLRGHRSWVKNVEYCSSSGLLISSGFDGNVFTWDINDYSEGERCHKRVFYMRDLMRSQLTPDESQLIVSSSHGFALVINDLDLSTLWNDVCNQHSGSRRRQRRRRERPVDEAPSQNGQRNSIHVISDFPPDCENDGGRPIISSLAIHPQGWCMLTRSTSRDDSVEWTCVHDIQPRAEEPKEAEDDGDSGSPPPSPPPVWRRHTPHFPWPRSLAMGPRPLRAPRSQSLSTVPTTSSSFRLIPPSSRPTTSSSSQSSSTLSPSSRPPGSLEGFSGAVVVEAPRLRDLRESGEIAQRNRLSDVLLAALVARGPGLRTGALARSSAPRRRHPSSSDSSEDDVPPPPGRAAFRLEASHPPRPRPRAPQMDSLLRMDLLDQMDTSDSSENELEEEEGEASENDVPDESVRQWLRFRAGRREELLRTPPFLHSGRWGDLPVPKLVGPPRRLFQCQEANVGRGFIKEQCFSPDGRVICSPFNHGVRVLSFNPECDDLCDCIPTSPTDLYELSTESCHAGHVVTTAFSPTACQFVSGCLGGKVVFHQPVF